MWKTDFPHCISFWKTTKLAVVFPSWKGTQYLNPEQGKKVLAVKKEQKFELPLRSPPWLHIQTLWYCTLSISTHPTYSDTVIPHICEHLSILEKCFDVPKIAWAHFLLWRFSETSPYLINRRILNNLTSEKATRIFNTRNRNWAYKKGGYIKQQDSWDSTKSYSLEHCAARGSAVAVRLICWVRSYISVPEVD